MVEQKRRVPLFDRLLIESHAHCNRSCWFCPRSYDRSGKYIDGDGRNVASRMPTEKILGLLDQAAALGFRGLVGFHHYSEPLLDTRNPTLASEARRRGMLPYLHTNGDPLRENDTLCRAVVEVYEKIVVGLYDYESAAELEEEKRFWERRLAGVCIEFSAIGAGGVQTGPSVGIPRALVPTDARMSIPDLTYAGAPCHRPQIRMIVQHDGIVCLCCEDTTGAFELGSVYESSLEALWFSSRHVEVVRDLMAGHRENYALCRNCPQPPTGRAAPGANAIEIALRHYRND